MKTVIPISGLSLSAIALCVFAGSSALAQPSDAIKPPSEVLEYQSAIFKDIGVVQRKAMQKDGRFLLATHGSFDFSDGPYTNYFVQVSPGYALSDFWEIYGTYTPMYISSPRSIVSKIESLELSNGNRATILYDKPQTSYGLELLWAPLYGKDSLGFRNLVRSDTFFKYGFAKTKYISGETGWRYYTGFGKTYFINRWSGFRASIVGNYVQLIIDNKKQFSFQAALEMGAMFYF